MTHRLKPLAALAAALFATGALAASFSEVDANGDGALTLAEAQAAMPELSTADFLAADANADGALSEAEFATLEQA
jgi:hypothetical protein